MIHQSVTIRFVPTGGGATDAVVAADQHVFIDNVTAGTLGPARTNAGGVLVAANGAGGPIPLDDSRQYLIVVLSSAPAATPAANTAASVGVQAGGRINVVPRIAVRITNAAGAPRAGLVCKLTVGGASRNVTTTAGGFVVSNDGSAGSVTVSSQTNALRSSTTTAPAAMLTMAPTPVTRAGTTRIQAAAPAGAIDFHITEWRYTLSHNNPDAAAQTATITRPAGENAATFQQFWEGEMCASGSLAVRFVTGANVRAAGVDAVAVTLTAADPFVTAFDVTVQSRVWTTTLTQNAEGTLTRQISTFHDTGEHGWNSSASQLTPKTINSGPNRGCKYVESVTGLAFTSNPLINSLLTNPASAFLAAQGTARVTAPANVQGRVIPTQFYTTNAAGDVTITNIAGLLTHLGLPATAQIQFMQKECISAADLLEGTRRHEHTHPNDLSHKANCLKALRALDPVKFIEAFVEAPGATAVQFGTILSNRAQLVSSAGPVHTIVDENATRTDGQLRFIGGQQIPDVNLDSAGNRRPVWNPATNSQLA